MKKIKTYLLIAVFSLVSFIAGLTISEVNASVNTVNSVQSVQNTQSNIYTQTVYVDGQRYIVFTSGSSSMAVVKK